ncbi:Gfo/Idh/MocA family oxidoreductase [candidate division KSB1 bacterium]|nr:Gfo/Idh/MocA family oxidoreductase [candidate division KSB1 bacterium]
MKQSRRDFLKTTLLTTAGAVAAPTIIPSTFASPNSPNNKINVGVIGCGRIARGHDIPETLKYDSARIVAVCDVDRKRMKEGKEHVENLYKKKTGKEKYVDVKKYEDFRDMCADKNIDAVIISTPDFWHALPAIVAAKAGKDIYVQKPLSLTIAEGRALSDTIHRTGRILQIGSQQRSLDPWPQFHKACELVRNGCIGELHTIKVGLPGDPGGEEEPEMAIPENLNYDMWLGSTPYAYYTEKRVHPQKDYSRPGWLRCEQFGAGMITGWGAHHIDTAHWGMGTEFTGPVEIEARAEFPETGLWNVHGKFDVKAKYANGVTMFINGEFPNGVRFEGSEGWIFVTRGNYAVTASDPVSKEKNSKSLDASDPKILESVIGPDEIHLYQSKEQHGNWLDCIRTRQVPVAPAEIGHRSCSACLVSHIAMKLPRKLYWDPENERFKNDDEANSMLSRPMRLPWRNYL